VIYSWQKTPKPAGYIEGGGYTWDQLTGIFKNTDVTSADHIDNCDGAQAMWIFAVSQAGVFQDYDSLDSLHTAPQHEFNVLYEPGTAYELTVGLIGGGGNMAPGASLELSLYYRDSTSNLVTVAVTSVTNSSDVFSNNTHFVDFHVEAPAVQPGDAWAGQHIGIRLLSLIDTNLEGGYWDVDNVRLAAIPPPVLSAAAVTNGQFQFILSSEPGLRYQILASSDLLLPRSNWATLGTITNVSGTTLFTDATPGPGRRFYQAHQVP
jgi:hypothetical protein